ncbi:MAG: nicotinate phosphoribosyltransferase, partial [Nocardioidaceae bacterium]
VGVAKRSKDKLSVGGRKYAWRRIGPHHGIATHEVIGIGADVAPPDGRQLLVPLVRAGERVYEESLDVVRDRSRRSLEELPPHARQLSHGEPAIETTYVKEER